MIIKVVGNAKEVKKSIACILSFMGRNAKLTDLKKRKTGGVI